MLLNRKIAVITGAASERGIGKATAKLFAQHGASVAIVDLDEESSVLAAANIGTAHSGYECDVSNHDRCTDLITRIVSDFGSVDIFGKRGRHNATPQSPGNRLRRF